MRLARNVIAIVSIGLLAACGSEKQDQSPQRQEAPADTNGADSMASNDAANGQGQVPTIPDAKERPLMQAQVVLERLGFGPGVIDGKMGISTHNAVSGFQEANDLDTTGELDTATKQALSQWSNIPATRIVTIPESWGDQTYQKIPDDPAKQAQMDRLGYESLDERLAERFHTTVDVLKELNPDGRPASKSDRSSASTGTPSADVSPSSTGDGTAQKQSVFRAGQTVRVPNIGHDRIDPSAVKNADWQRTLASLGVGSEQPDVTKIVVDKSSGWLKAFDASGKLVAMFTVTSGSEHDPLPIGTWGITGISHNPDFAFDPDLFWDVPDSTSDQRLPPGPNGPVGVVWIDLTKEHYGIHGTSEPQTIGRAQSHGCVRLTNWDAARLAEMVGQKTEVVFQP